MLYHVESQVALDILLGYGYCPTFVDSDEHLGLIRGGSVFRHRASLTLQNDQVTVFISQESFFDSRLTQPTMQYVPRAFFRGVKCLGLEAEHLRASGVEVNL